MKWGIAHHAMRCSLVVAGVDDYDHAIIGAAITAAVLEEVLAPWANDMVKQKPHEDHTDRIEGIPFVVCEGLKCDIIFFTDANVWRRFLQHTDQ